jgi:cohesin complex subunit SCC1
MADLNDIDVQAQFSVNQSRPEEITMREDHLGNITLVGDDGFGDMGFDDRNLIQDAHMDESLYKTPTSSSMLLDSTVDKDGGADKSHMDIDLNAPPKDDGFGDAMIDYGVGENLMPEGGGLFEEPPVPEVPPPAEVEQPQPSQQQREEEFLFGTGAAEETSRPADETHGPQEQTTVMSEQTTLVHNEAEAFALEPLDITTLGTERKAKRKRKLIVDEQKGIPSETMKLQLSDTSEIVTTLDLAPPTKKLMHWKETGGVEKLFALPGRAIASRRIGKLFQKNLITKPLTTEEVQEFLEGDRIELDVPELPREEEEPRHVEAVEPPPMEPPSLVEPPSMIEEPSMSHIEPEPAPLAETSIMSTASKPAEESTILHPPTPAPPSVRPEPEPEDEDNEDIFMDIPSVPDGSMLGNDKEPTEAEAEEMEERRWNKRSQQMIHIIERQLQRTEQASFKDLISRNNRKQVASKFYTLLVLKKQQAIDVEQTGPYGDILISRGPTFEMVCG